MKRGKVILLIAMLAWTICPAQNLVPNPGFETTTGCPPGNSGISSGYAPPWNRPPGGITTPDLYHPCGSSGLSCSNCNVPNNFGGYSTAFEGVAYAGLLTYYTSCPNCREYIQAPLLSAMTAGTNYEIRMRVKLAPLSRYATNRMGIHITTGSISQPSNQAILVTPTYQHPSVITDKVNWTLVSTVYTSSGGENYITIGNFYANASTTITDFGSSGGSCALVTNGNIYYIDSIYVGPITVLDESRLNLTGEYIGNDVQLHWNAENISSSEMRIQHSFTGTDFQTIHEPQNENAFVHRDVGSGMHYYRIISLDVNGNEFVSNVLALKDRANPVTVNCFPNPATDFVNFELTGWEKNREEPIAITIRDISGKSCERISRKYSGGIISIPTSNLASGIYVLEISLQETKQYRRFVVESR